MRPTYESIRRTLVGLLPRRRRGPERRSTRRAAHPSSGRDSRRPSAASDGVPPPPRARPYPGDATRLPDTTYAPRHDGEPDAGEIVWAWVPFEEDHAVGKDRPVLVVGREGDWLVAMSLTSRDHDRDEHQERSAGREWIDIGTGPWDRHGRPSEVRINRLVRLDPAVVRREGAVLEESRYAAVIRGARSLREARGNPS